MSIEKRLADALSENPDRVLGRVLLIAFGAAVVVSTFFAWRFWGMPFSNDPQHWGQLGDYVGGLLNPVFGFLSVFALLVTLVLQSRELTASREALKVSQTELELSRKAQTDSAAALAAQNRTIHRQSFEQTFFAWFGTYQTLLGEIECQAPTNAGVLVPTVQVLKGRPALRQLWAATLSDFGIQKQLAELADNDLWQKEYQAATGGEDGIYTAWTETFSNETHKRLANKETFLDILKSIGMTADGWLITHAATLSWDDLYHREEYQLDSLFRSLYRLIKWIDELPDEDFKDNRLRWHYIGIIRSQLSWIEMVFLFFNGLSSRGEKFRVFVERYALFDNLNSESDYVLKYLRDHPPDGIPPYKDSAFNSDTARAAHIR